MTKTETQVKHTPGPWVFSKQVGSRPVWELIEKSPIHEDDPGQFVARIWQCEEGEANARLIASAPELLAALKKMYENFDVCIHGGKAPHDQLKTAADARAAIAKAEGRE